MRAEHINPFLNATINMFQQMFGLTPDALDPYVLEHSAKHRWEISGILGITGEARGLIAIRFHRALTLKLLQKSGITTTNPDDEDEMINSMVGELINIVAGNAVSAMSGQSIDISPPIIVQGENHRLSWPKSEPTICIPFRTPTGPFVVNVCIK
ncbi:chemotaxis protein CheX [Alkalispirochaeta americana]|uniref:Chemotaxis protein CheX n=1 Tax=Alkalispirochaeta americana TaxID=159291 RepID=A0A1N6RGR2_9SPIO|nr:chemotaxis protein CheX [Alkalispirochaeta americana]SIQ28050.1 chemotaxis protein CheX [Alkalispirochaeta americana]